MRDRGSMGSDTERGGAASKEAFDMVTDDRSVRADGATGKRRAQVGGGAGGTTPESRADRVQRKLHDVLS